jgi:DNA repair photolyase
MPLEREVNLTGRALELIAQFGFMVHVMTKSDLVLRDLDTLAKISERYATVSFTITTADDELGKKLEPGAALVSDRFKAMRIIADRGIQTGISFMPLLPFIEDTEENVTAIVKMAHEHGASYIIPSFGMTMRDRQRAYYYGKLDELFPGLREKYERMYRDQYHCAVPNADRLYKLFHELCERYSISPRIIPYEPQTAQQLRLL